MSILPYDRFAAVEYARRWAFSRNPNYYDFRGVGGDCTSFASQCLYAGAQVMNFTPDVGWYYRSVNDRAAAWTGVEYFYRFLTANYVNPQTFAGGVGDGAGPFAQVTPLPETEIGDFLQLGRMDGAFYHTLVVVGFDGDTPLVAAHTNDAYNRPLTSYSFARLRCLHILGVRRV